MLRRNGIDAEQEAIEAFAGDGLDEVAFAAFAEGAEDVLGGFFGGGHNNFGGIEAGDSDGFFVFSEFVEGLMSVHAGHGNIKKDYFVGFVFLVGFNEGFEGFIAIGSNVGLAQRCEQFIQGAAVKSGIIDNQGTHAVSPAGRRMTYLYWRYRSERTRG